MIMMKKQLQQPWMMMMFSKQVFSMINSSSSTSSSSSSSSSISLINSTLLLCRRPLCSSTATTNTSCLSSVTQPPTVSDNTNDTQPPTVSDNTSELHQRQKEKLNILLEKKHPLLIVPYNLGTSPCYLSPRICYSDDYVVLCDGTLGFINLFQYDDNDDDDGHELIFNNRKYKRMKKGDAVVYLDEMLNRYAVLLKAVTNTTNSTTLQPTTVVVMAIYEYYGGLAFCRTSLSSSSTGNGIVEPAAWIKIPVKTPMSAGLLTRAQLNSRAKQRDNDITFEIIDGVTYWVTINFGWLADVTFYQGNFYVVGMKGAVGVVKGLDNSSPFVQFLIDGPKGLGYSEISKYKYLVESSSSSSSGGGDLLMISRYVENVAESGTETEENEEEEEEEWTFERPYRTTTFDVVKLNLNNGLSASWEEVTDLGEDCALFIGYNHSFSVSASKIPGCRGNCIYFTDNNVEKTDYFTHGGHDIGVYNLEDDSFEKLNYETWSDQLLLPPPVWYQAQS